MLSISTSGANYTEPIATTWIMDLEKRRNKSDLIEVYKIANGLSTLPTSTFFEFRADTRIRGHSLKLMKNDQLG